MTDLAQQPAPRHVVEDGELTVGLGIPVEVHAVRLHKIVRGDLVACEAIAFAGGATAVDTTLRRAAISGRVEIGGEIADHFADLLDEDGDLIETVSLDARSYKALKTRWMPTKHERVQP